MESATPRQECVVYCSTRPTYLFLLGELVRGESSAFNIARQYDCELELRPAQWRQSHRTNYLPPPRVKEDGSCTAAVLVGGDRERMSQARDDIWKTIGVNFISCGWFEIGKKEKEMR